MPALLCLVCDEHVDDPMLLEVCGYCFREFHLNPFGNREGKDCGQVLTGSADSPALQFLCITCHERYEEGTLGLEGADGEAAGAAGAQRPASPGKVALSAEQAILLGVAPGTEVEEHIALMLSTMQQAFAGGVPGGSGDPFAGLAGASEDDDEYGEGRSAEADFMQRLMRGDAPAKGSDASALTPPED